MNVKVPITQLNMFVNLCMEYGGKIELIHDGDYVYGCETEDFSIKVDKYGNFAIEIKNKVNSNLVTPRDIVVNTNEAAELFKEATKNTLLKLQRYSKLAKFIVDNKNKVKEIEIGLYFK